MRNLHNLSNFGKKIKLMYKGFMAKSLEADKKLAILKKANERNLVRFRYFN
jgi:hypothetical protein